MRVPRTVEFVKGKPIRFVYKKELTNKDGTTDYGRFDGPHRLVEISLDQSAQQMAETIHHELCHAVLFVTGHSERLGYRNEEALVIALELLNTLYKLDPKSSAITWTNIDI